MIIKRSTSFFPWYGYIGLLAVLISEILLFTNVEVVGMYFTPLAWTGYILFADALNFMLKGQSLIRTRTKEFLLMLPWSVFCWLIFETYNLYLQNWHYIGLPEGNLQRWLGYVWSFATIFPGILETTELVQPFFAKVHVRRLIPSKRKLCLQVGLGAICLTLPLMVEQLISKYLMALVWMGFAFLLEPINHLLGGRSLFQEFAEGRLTKLTSLFVGGLICGILWEFWNYWAAAKWVYDVPIPFAGPKIFEMPLLGFLGFLPFAVECYSMRNSLMLFVERKQN
jgi:hypothetical protein